MYFSSLLFSPINQISSGFQNLLVSSSSSYNRSSPRVPSYSAIIKKEPLDNRPQINFVKVSPSRQIKLICYIACVLHA